MTFLVIKMYRFSGVGFNVKEDLLRLLYILCYVKVSRLIDEYGKTRERRERVQ